jgi:hypothetical protein
LPSECDLLWILPGDIIPDRETQTIQLPRLMLTVVWNPRRFHVLKDLPKEGKFNAQQYPNNILGAFSDWRRLAGGARPNNFWIPENLAHIQTVKVSVDFTALNLMKQGCHSLIHQISHHWTSFFSVTSEEG